MELILKHGKLFLHEFPYGRWGIHINKSECHRVTQGIAGEGEVLRTGGGGGVLS